MLKEIYNERKKNCGLGSSIIDCVIIIILRLQSRREGTKLQISSIDFFFQRLSL